MAQIYYAGDWAVLNGPVFAESPFNYAHKGIDIFNYGQWLVDALEATGTHRVQSVPSWDFYNLRPGAYEQILDTHDVIIFSDIEAKLFQLAPHFFDREKFGKGILTFPDRVRLTVEAVQAGKSVMFLGGWLSFTGELGKGGWGRSGLRDILPVVCLDHEDLTESTEGFTARYRGAGKDPLSDMDFSTFPPILGYNKTIKKPGFDILLEVQQTGDPLLATGSVGDGKVLAYMSDPAPHWGCNFVYWKQYKVFWQHCLEIVLG